METKIVFTTIFAVVQAIFFFRLIIKIADLGDNLWIEILVIATLGFFQYLIWN